jgi:hypothetical protein
MTEPCPTRCSSHSRMIKMIAISHQGDDTMRKTFTRAVAAGLLGCAIGGITLGVAFAGAGVPR